MSNLSKNLLKASFIGTMAETMILPLWTFITNRAGGSILDAGIGFGLFSIATGLVVIFVGKTSWYKKNIRSMVFWGFVVSGCGDFMYLFINSVPMLFMVQSIVGISVGLLNPAWDSLYSEDEHEDKWSIWSGGVNMATGIAAIIGGLSMQYLGYTPFFIIVLVVDLIAASYAYRILK